MTANSLELAILNRIATDNPRSAPLIASLAMDCRELTGAGSYTYFLPKALSALPNDGYIGSVDSITLPGVCALGASLSCASGRVELDIYTLGNTSWDGSYDTFSLA